MAIKVACPKCKKVLVAKDEMAGRTVRCPQCEQRLKLPAPRSAQPASAGKPAAPTQPATAMKSAAAAQPAAAKPSAAAMGLAATATANPLPSLFDEEYGLDTPTVTGPPCPGCRRPFPADKVLCIECGYHRGKGKKVGMERPVAQAHADSGIAPEGVSTKVRKTKKASSSTSDGGEMAGGIVLMGGAAAWLYWGVTQEQKIYFYPIYLFIAGLAAFARGFFR